MVPIFYHNKKKNKTNLWFLRVCSADYQHHSCEHQHHLVICQRYRFWHQTPDLQNHILGPAISFQQGFLLILIHTKDRKLIKCYPQIPTNYCCKTKLKVTDIFNPHDQSHPINVTQNICNFESFRAQNSVFKLFNLRRQFFFFHELTMPSTGSHKNCSQSRFYVKVYLNFQGKNYLFQ